MKTIYFLIIFSFQLGIASNKGASAEKQMKESFPPLYSRHWFGSIPWLSKEKGILLAHRIFFISFNVTTGFPDWMAYELSPHIIYGELKAERKLKPDPLLAKAIKNNFKNPLKFRDYKGASSFGYDKGHLAPKGSFKGSLFAFEAQYMTNIVPQKRDLNQGPWRNLEERIRQFVGQGNNVKILTGPLYGEALNGKRPFQNPLPIWPQAQGKIFHIPTGFWKTVFIKEKSFIKVCSFLMPQNLGKYNRKTSPKKFIVTIQDLRKFIPLNFQGIKNLKEDCRFLY